MRAFQLLCVSLVVVASVSGAATGTCGGVHTTTSKSCDTYDESECLNAKNLGCVWEVATGGSSTGDTAPAPKMEGDVGDKDAAPAPKPVAGGTAGTDKIACVNYMACGPDPNKYDKTSCDAEKASGGCLDVPCGGPPECAKYDEIVCKAEKPLGCFWFEPTKDTDSAPAPKPVEDKPDDDTKDAAPAPKPVGGDSTCTDGLAADVLLASGLADCAAVKIAGQCTDENAKKLCCATCSDATAPDKDAAPAPKPVEDKPDDDTKDAAPAPGKTGEPDVGDCAWGGVSTAGACKLSNGQPGTCGVNYGPYTVNCCPVGVAYGSPTCEDSSVQASCAFHSATANEGKRCLFTSGGYGKCEAGECKQSAGTAPTGSCFYHKWGRQDDGTKCGAGREPYESTDPILHSIMADTADKCCKPSTGTMDGASFCGETTKWDAATNKCQATFNGALAACKAHRGDYGWTCEVACKA